jgi:MFS family permease
MAPKRPLVEPLLTPKANTGSTRKRNRVLAKHDSVIEQYVATHPIKAQDLIYPTNIMVVEDMTAATLTAVTPELGIQVLGKEMDEKLRIQLLLETLPSQRIAMLVTIAVFSGYAALFSLQHVVKVFFGIPDDNSLESHQYSYAITVQYISNLIFRLGQNWILSPFSPRQRCVFGLVAMGVAMSILGVGIFTLQYKSLPLLGLAYGFGGCAVGVFETNYSVVLAALGNRTKIFGISGIPIGIFLVIVPGFIAVGMGMDVRWIYASVVGLICLGILILFKIIHYPKLESLMSWDSPMHASPPHLSPRKKKSSLNWILPVISIGIVFTLNMLFVAAFSPGVLLYLLNGPFVNLFPPSEDEEGLGIVRTSYFFAIFSSFGFVGDVVSRRIVYSQKPNFHPIWYLLLTATGVGIIVTMIPMIAPIGTFLIFFANGSIYAQSCRMLDSRLDMDVSVLGNSLFFFLGDCGSVIGAISIPFIRDLLTDVL